jgi:hypothetical protein
VLDPAVTPVDVVDFVTLKLAGNEKLAEQRTFWRLK